MLCGMHTIDHHYNYSTAEKQIASMTKFYDVQYNKNNDDDNNNNNNNNNNSRDERGFPLTQYITNGRISRARYTITHFKHYYGVLRLISYRMSV